MGGKTAIFEFRLTQNMSLLQRAAPEEPGGKQELRHSIVRLELPKAQPVMEDDKAYLDPKYASGQIFTPQVLGGLIGLAYHTPGLLEVMSALMIPDAGSDKSHGGALP